MSSLFPKWKQDLIERLKKEQRVHNHKLCFIHTPKCGGIYANQYVNYFTIPNKGHKQATISDGITFTIIRHPVDRFESLLNYRLGEAKPRADWNPNLSYIFQKPEMTLNEIVEKMSDADITRFIPYRTLTYWSTNVRILLTMSEFLPFLTQFGYKTDIEYPRQNVSPRTRGNLSTETRARIAKLFEKDIKLYELWTRK